MKRHKRILPSTLALIMLTTSVSTTNVFAETLNENSGDETNSVGESATEEGVTEETVTEITSGSGIQIVPKEIITPRIANGDEFIIDGWECRYTLGWGGGFIITGTEHKSGNVTIPDKLNQAGTDYKVVGLGAALFQDATELKTVTMPDHALVLDENIFQGCTSLTEVKLPSNQIMISGSCFKDCKSLSKINIPDTIAIIGASAFENCTSLTKVKIPEGITEIRENTFKGCKSLTEVELPESLVNIFRHSFDGCTSLTEIKLPSGLKGLYNNAFDNTGLLYIDIPSNLTSLDLSFIGSNTITPEAKSPYQHDSVEDKAISAYTNEPITGKVVDITSLPADDYKGKTLYMQYNITPLLDLNGGTMGSDKVFPAWVTDVQIVENSDKYLSIPEKRGYSFTGWKVVNAETLNKDGKNYLIGSVELKAEWLELGAVDVTFNADGGTPATTVIAQFEGQKILLPETEPIKKGYVFVGWFDKNGNKITENTVFGNATENIQYTAKWEKETIEEILKNVTFDTNDGTLTKFIITQIVGTNFKLPDLEPVRDGYEFLGWFNDSGTKITGDTLVDELEDGTVFHAKWSKKDEDTDTDTDSDNIDTGANIDNNSGNIENANNSGNGGNASNNLNDNLGTDGEQSQNTDLGKILFNVFSVKAGSNEFITRYSDGTVKHSYAYNKTYIDPTTKTMYVSLRGVIDNSIDRFEITWNPKTSSAEVTFVDKGTKIVFTANSSIMTVNGVERQMLSAEGEVINAQLDNGRLMIPLRFVSELFDFNVKYDNETKNSIVYTSRVEM